MQHSKESGACFLAEHKLTQVFESNPDLSNKIFIHKERRKYTRQSQNWDKVGYKTRKVRFDEM